MADVTQLPKAAPSSGGGDVSPIAKRIKRELLLKKAAKDARKHNTDGDMNAQHQRFSFEQELQSKVMAKRLKLRSIHRRFKSSSEAMMCRLYKDLNDFPDFPNVSVKLIFANGNQHTFQRIGVNQREALEHTQQALDHELQQQTNHHHQPQEQSPVKSLEEDSDASIVDEDGDVVALKVVITPMRGPWKHVAVPFRLDLPKTYPHEPPKITCIKRIYHPSVDQRGYVCLGLINEWESFLNLEAVVIELENLLVDPSPRRPLVKDVGNELFENPELFEENVKISMRGGVVRGVYYDRLAGVPPVDIGHDTLRNICFNKIFEYLKADKRAELKLKMQSRAMLSPRAAYEVELLNEKGKEILNADDQVVSAVPVTNNDNNNFDKEGIKHLPIELREIVEDYMSIIDTNERHRRARKIIKAQQANAVIGGKIFVKNLAGNMIQLDGVRPDMTIWQVKELLDTKTGMVPHTIQLFWHQVLDDKKTVADYGMRQGSVLYIVLSWGGG